MNSDPTKSFSGKGKKEEKDSAREEEENKNKKTNQSGRSDKMPDDTSALRKAENTKKQGGDCDPNLRHPIQIPLIFKTMGALSFPQTLHANSGWYVGFKSRPKPKPTHTI